MTGRVAALSLRARRETSSLLAASPVSSTRATPRGRAALALVLGLLVGVAGPLAARQQPKPPTEVPAVTAFVDVAVVPMDRERMLPHQTVVVRGDRIVALGPAARVAVPAEAVRVDGRDKFLMPGLADMHVHLVNWFTGGGSDTTFVADRLLMFLANGVTTVRDMHSGDKDSWTLRLRRRVASGELLGPRVYTAGDPDVSSPAAAARSVAALKAAGHDFVKFYGWPRPLYDSIVLTAHRVGLPVVGHPSGDLLRVLNDHWASIEHSDGYMVYLTGNDWVPDSGVRLDPARLRALAVATRRGGVWVCPTLSIMVPAISYRGRWDARHMHLQIVKALQDAGAGLLLGTDSPGNLLTPPGFSIHRELELLVEAGLTPYQALLTGTRNVARFLGTEDSTGTVAMGKRADLVLLNADPLRNIRNTTTLAGVMLGGRWLPQEELNARLDSVAVVPVGGDSTQGSWRLFARLARVLMWR